jgi:hypothetical protein
VSTEESISQFSSDTGKARYVYPLKKNLNTSTKCEILFQNNSRAVYCIFRLKQEAARPLTHSEQYIFSPLQSKKTHREIWPNYFPFPYIMKHPEDQEGFQILVKYYGIWKPFSNDLK